MLSELSFPGILLPLAMENCTLQEAAIISSVLKKVSIPPLHSAAAMIKLCELKPWYPGELMPAARATLFRSEAPLLSCIISFS